MQKKQLESQERKSKAASLKYRTEDKKIYLFLESEKF